MSQQTTSDANLARVDEELVAALVAVLRKRGHKTPETAAAQMEAANRTASSVANLVNAFEGRDPFSGVLPDLTATPAPVTAVYEYTVDDLRRDIPLRSAPPEGSHVRIVLGDTRKQSPTLNAERVCHLVAWARSVEVVGLGPDVVWLTKVISDRRAAWARADATDWKPTTGG